MKVGRAQAVSLHQRGGYLGDYVGFNGTTHATVKECQWIFETGNVCGRDVVHGANFSYCRVHLPKAITVCASRAVEDWVDGIMSGVGTLEPQEG